MGRWRERIAKTLVPGLMTQSEVKALVTEEVKTARQSIPISLDYDPKGEGYRRSGLGDNNVRRDLTPISQDLMLELAYYMYDASGLVKRFVRDTKNFVLGEGITYEIKNDEAGHAKEILDDFWGDAINQMSLRLDSKIEFLGLLGEQCWPVDVNPVNGRVWLSYLDPANIEDVFTVRNFPEVAAQIKAKGRMGRRGKPLSVIREQTDPRLSDYGRLVGDCFYFAVNKPPNAARGRSDLIQSFDFIGGFEEGIFDELDRLKLIKGFIWDVLLKGATDDEIKNFLQNNKTPKSGSVRAHNENVEWNVVAPDMKHSDNKALFDMIKSYLAACQNRPDAWIGSGGKSYQTEADLMGEPTFKDLGARQRYVKYMLEYVLRFALDQAVIHKTLREPDNDRFTVVVNMPEMTTKDLKKIVDGLNTLAQSLMIAQGSGWLSDEKVAAIYASVAAQVGVDIDAADEIKKAAEKNSDPVTEDYAARESIIRDVVARLETGGLKP